MSDELDGLLDAAEQAYLDADPREAIRLAQQVCKLAPGETSALHILGCAAYAAGDKKLSKATLKKLIDGCTKALKRTTDEGERAHFDQILRTVGDDLVESAEGSKALAAARFLYRDVGARTPVVLQAVAARAPAKELLPMLEALKVLEPKDAVVRYRLAAAHAGAGRKPKLLAELEAAITLDRASVRALKDSAFKKFWKDAAFVALCNPAPADTRVRNLYVKLERCDFEEVIADGDAMLGTPTDTLAVLEAMNDALENLVHGGEHIDRALHKRVAAQLSLLKRAGAKSEVYENFLYQSLKG